MCFASSEEKKQQTCTAIKSENVYQHGYTNAMFVIIIASIFSIMGHGSDVGIIPRFCEELFSRADLAREHDKVR